MTTLFMCYSLWSEKVVGWFSTYFSDWREYLLLNLFSYTNPKQSPCKHSFRSIHVYYLSYRLRVAFLTVIDFSGPNQHVLLLLVAEFRLSWMGWSFYIFTLMVVLGRSCIWFVLCSVLKPCIISLLFSFHKS
jgi:hypothetical protein